MYAPFFALLIQATLLHTYNGNVHVFLFKPVCPSMPPRVLHQSLISELPQHLRVCTTRFSQLLPFIVTVSNTALDIEQLIKTS